jgi:hypothetical protein
MSHLNVHKITISKVSLLEDLCHIRSDYVKCIYCTTGYFTKWTDNQEMQCYKCRKTIGVKNFLRGRSKQEILSMIKETKLKKSLVRMAVNNDRW